MAEEKAKEAEPLLKESVEIARNTPRGGGANQAEKEGKYGECLGVLGRYPEAEQVLVKSLAAMRAARGDESKRTSETARRLAAVYRKMGQPDRADDLAGLIRGGTKN
jgi:hypothetical protein